MGLSLLASREPEVEKRVGSVWCQARKTKMYLTTPTWAITYQEHHPCLVLNRQEVERYRFCIFVVIECQDYFSPLKFST